jgi:hypothetical protein
VRRGVRDVRAKGAGPRRLWLAAALATCLGVVLAVLPTSCSDECERSNDCPTGQYCVDGSCRARDIDGGTDADADVEFAGDGDVGPDSDADFAPDESAGAEDAEEVEEAEDAGDDGVPCPEGLTWCGGPECIDPLTTDEHCGACDHACGTGEMCVGGTCGVACSGAGLSCGGECVDRLSDPDNCGTCDDPCAEPQLCAAGDCVMTCPEGTTPCGRACADTASSIDHCGSCDNPCGNLQWCIGGMCLDSPCAMGDLFCDGGCVPQDVNNCGACGTICDTGFACCNRLFADGMICANLASDPQYCGSCTNLCPAGENCVAGVCTPV